MEQTLFTPRLVLTLITTAKRGSQELEWLHELRCDSQATWWSLRGRSKTLEDTENIMKGSLPIPTKEGEPKTYRAVYAVHELLSGPSHPSTPIPDLKTVEKRFIGLILLHALGPNDLALPDHMFPPSSLAPECLTIQIGYLFLPGGWGKGYATESVKAVFEACKKETAFWAPYEKVYIRVVVNAENPASQRVVVKTGMEELGVYVWSGERIWIAGKWRTTDRLYISGKFLKE